MHLFLETDLFSEDSEFERKLITHKSLNPSGLVKDDSNSRGVIFSHNFNLTHKINNTKNITQKIIHLIALLVKYHHFSCSDSGMNLES